MEVKNDSGDRGTLCGSEERSVEESVEEKNLWKEGSPIILTFVCRTPLTIRFFPTELP